MKKAVSFIMTLFFISTAIFVRSTDKNFITVCFLETGNSDCIIVKTQESAILIDTALQESYSYIDSKLKSMNIEKLDCLIITHYDKDHVGSAADVIKDYEPDEIYVTYDRPKVYSKAHKNFINIVKELKLEPTIIRENTSFQFSDTTLEIIPPKSDSFTQDASNNSSLMISLEYGSTSFLMTGDIESERIAEILTDGIGEYDVLKVPHHGWIEDNTSDLFKAVSPRYSVITNSTGYRKIPSTVAALISCGSYIYSTANGEVTFKCYKNHVAVSQIL